MLFSEFQAGFFQHNVQECQKLYISEICGTGFSKELSLHFNTWEKKLIFQKVPAKKDSRGRMDVVSFKNQVLYCVGFGAWFVFWFWWFFKISGVNFQLCCVHKINCM